MSFIIILVVLSSIYYFSIREKTTSFPAAVVSKVKDMVKNSTTPSSVSTPVAAVSEPQNDTSMESLQGISDAALENWVQAEARSMDSTNNNTDEVQLKIRALARTLTAPQLQKITQMALNLSLPADNRIFAAYLLNLTELPESNQAMMELAKTPLPDLGPILAHSEAEIKHGQELAIRYMQVDELFARAKTDTNARDNLSLLARQAESERVRSYAEKKLKELK